MAESSDILCPLSDPGLAVSVDAQTQTVTWFDTRLAWTTQEALSAIRAEAWLSNSQARASSGIGALLDSLSPEHRALKARIVARLLTSQRPEALAIAAPHLGSLSKPGLVAAFHVIARRLMTPNAVGVAARWLLEACPTEDDCERAWGVFSPPPKAFNDEARDVLLQWVPDRALRGADRDYKLGVIAQANSALEGGTDHSFRRAVFKLTQDEDEEIRAKARHTLDWFTR